MDAVSAIGASQAAATGKTMGDMSTQDFLNLIIQQLLNQDPLNPMDNNELLSQISQIKSIESDLQLTQSLQTLVLQQSVAAAGNLIGKVVTGYDVSGMPAEGVVQGVQVSQGKVYLNIGDTVVPFDYVTGISPQITEDVTNG